MDLLAGLPGLIAALSAGGPFAVGAATLLVGCVAALILSSRVREMLAGTKAVEQSTQVQATMLDIVRMLREDETRLRKKIDALESDNDVLRDDVMELRTTLSLIRHQRRRLLRLLRAAAADGRLPEGSVEGTDLVVPT